MKGFMLWRQELYYVPGKTDWKYVDFHQTLARVSKIYREFYAHYHEMVVAVDAKMVPRLISQCHE